MKRLLRLRAVEELVGIKRTQIAEHVKRGEFPPPIKLTDTGRAVAWLEEELITWRDERAAKRPPADEAA